MTAGAGLPWVTSLVRIDNDRFDVVATVTRHHVGRVWRNDRSRWSGEYIDDGRSYSAGANHAALAAAWLAVERAAMFEPETASPAT